MERLLSVRETAELLGVCKATVYRYVYSRQIPFVRFNGRILFDEKRLRIFIEEHAVEPIPEEVSAMRNRRIDK